MLSEPGIEGLAAEAAKQHEAKMEKQRTIDAKVAAIKQNPGENRSDEEIRQQAEAEVEARVEMN